MVGYEQRISGVGSNRSADFATTTLICQRLANVEVICILDIGFFTCLIFPIPFENTNRSLLMVGYDPRMSGVGSNRSANCAAAVCPNQAEIYKIS